MCPSLTRPWSSISRLRRKRPVYAAGLDHTYHRLLVLLDSPNRAVLVMQLAAFGFNCLAFLGLYQPPLLANAIFLLVFLLAAAALIFLDRPRFWV